MGQSSASAAAHPGGRRLAELVTRASALSAVDAADGIHRMLPVAPALRRLLPGGGLRRGQTVAVTAGASSLVLGLLAQASASGAWTAVVGMPALSPLAAAQAGLVLERTGLVPGPGPQWPAVVAALIDGVDVLVVAPPGPVSARVASRLTARARQQGCVLVPCGPWEGADLTLTAQDGRWYGLAGGRGRLRYREVTVVARGRRAASRPVEVRLQLPAGTGRPARLPVGAEESARLPVGADRPTLTVVRGAEPAGDRKRASGE